MRIRLMYQFLIGAMYSLCAVVALAEHPQDDKTEKRLAAIDAFAEKVTGKRVSLEKAHEMHKSLGLVSIGLPVQVEETRGSLFETLGEPDRTFEGTLPKG